MKNEDKTKQPNVWSIREVQCIREKLSYWYPNVQTIIGIRKSWPSEKPGARAGAGSKSLPKFPVRLAILVSDFLSPQNQTDTKNNSNGA